MTTKTTTNTAPITWDDRTHNLQTGNLRLNLMSSRSIRVIVVQGRDRLELSHSVARVGTLVERVTSSLDLQGMLPEPNFAQTFDAWYASFAPTVD